jgi:hypothetical protein
MLPGRETELARRPAGPFQYGALTRTAAGHGERPRAPGMEHLSLPPPAPSAGSHWPTSTGWSRGSHFRLPASHQRPEYRPRPPIGPSAPARESHRMIHNRRSTEHPATDHRIAVELTSNGFSPFAQNPESARPLRRFRRSQACAVGRWDSNPRPTDYESFGDLGGPCRSVPIHAVLAGQTC